MIDRFRFENQDNARGMSVANRKKPARELVRHGYLSLSRAVPNQLAG
jgi:hypothetical protein